MRGVPMRYLTTPALAALVLCAACSCDDEEQGWTNKTLSGAQTGAVTFGDRTRVTVSSSVTFEAGASLDLDGQVEFLMDPTTSFELPADLQVANGSRITYKAGGATAWQKLRVSQPTVLIEDFTISGAIIGLDLSGSGAATLRGLTISDCEQYGLYAINLDSLIIEQSNFADCGTDNAHIKFSKVRLQYSTFTGAASAGVYSLDNGLHASDCTFSHCVSSGISFDGVNTSYRVEYCLFDSNHYGLRDTANRDVILRHCNFLNQGYFPLQFAHPFADRVLFEQNNILPGLGVRRIELATTGAYRVNRYLPAANNWWGTTDLAEITSMSSLVGDGRHTANSDTIRVEPILLVVVEDAGPR